MAKRRESETGGGGIKGGAERRVSRMRPVIRESVDLYLEIIVAT